MAKIKPTRLDAVENHGVDRLNAADLARLQSVLEGAGVEFTTTRPACASRVGISGMSEHDRRRRAMIFGCIMAALLAIYIGTTFHDAIADTLMPIAP